MKIIVSLSTPQEDHTPLTPDQQQFNLSVDRTNCELAEYYLRSGVPIRYGSQSYMLTRNIAGTALALIEHGLIKVWVLYQERPSSHIFSNHSYFEEHVVWSAPEPEYRGVVRALYLDHLIPQYKVIESSNLHRPPGRTMWYKLVQSALERGICVTAVIPPTVVSISSFDTLEKLAPQLWGSSNEYRATRLFLSTMKPNV